MGKLIVPLWAVIYDGKLLHQRRTLFSHHYRCLSLNIYKKTSGIMLWYIQPSSHHDEPYLDTYDKSQG
ncbi:hypothetical protein E2C01_080544 [Portunus trituberculatus]|uniref:Uncharacterized protein n=1 Tax=Portunus trituberculatus TaxID=210409 RepID=A0A5B7IZW6_PORTR|nr:hypothetical protein [Portunus trituberculatus]